MGITLVTTQTHAVDPTNPGADVIRRAAAVVRAGGLVAFPTETVYGLGANALDPAAVARIFAAKGRPATNPVIVHVADAAQVVNVAAAWPETAARLAAAFWPGPLTLVVPRRPDVPDIVAAGGPTVGVRCPAHAVARALIREAGVPVAAPSANRSTELSPTRAEHVLKSLNGRIDVVLDGGPCPGGIESTVVDVTGGAVRVLRPGLITVPMLEAVVGELANRGEASRERERPEIARSPGQMAKHYSPRTPILLTADRETTARLVQDQEDAGNRVGLLLRDCEPYFSVMWITAYRHLPDDPAGYAAWMYQALHEFDGKHLSVILVEMPPDTPEWAAVRDRLTRAAAP